MAPLVAIMQVSSHMFRSQRRRAAIERKDSELRKLHDALHELREENAALRGRRQEYIVVEKIVEVPRVVEVPVEKTVERIIEVPVEKYVEGGFTEEDVTMAFRKGTEMATAAKEELAKTMIQKMKEMKAEHEEKFEAAATKELKLKDLLRKSLEEKREIQAYMEAAKDSQVMKDVNKLEREFAEAEAEVRRLKAKVEAFEKMRSQELEESSFQRQISEMVGVDVPKEAVMEIKRQFENRNEPIDNENLTALYDCNVLDIWKHAYDDFKEALGKAMDGGGDRSSSAESGEGEYSSGDDESLKEDEVECEELMAWERECG